MSVTSRVGGRLIDWNRTISDWAAIARAIDGLVSDECGEVFGALTFPNGSVPRAAVRLAIAEVMALARLVTGVRAMVEEMEITLNDDGMRRWGQYKRADRANQAKHASQGSRAR